MQGGALVGGMETEAAGQRRHAFAHVAQADAAARVLLHLGVVEAAAVVVDGQAQVAVGVGPVSYTHLLWPAPAVLHADRLADALRRLPRHWLRAKGWVRTERHGWVLVQLAGRRVRFDTQAARPSEVRSPSLVFIGMRGTTQGDELTARLAAAAA